MRVSTFRNTTAASFLIVLVACGGIAVQPSPTISAPIDAPTALPTAPPSESSTAVAGLEATIAVLTTPPEPTLVPQGGPSPIATPAQEPQPASVASEEPQTNEGADVMGVSVSGNPGAYTFSVTVRSPDTGCGRYADWWEVVSPEGRLIYRRVLLHSHVDEQPFTRSGGPAGLQPDEIVIVRAHMNDKGYGGIALSGNVADGFSISEIPPGFAADVESQEPLPAQCAF